VGHNLTLVVGLQSRYDEAEGIAHAELSFRAGGGECRLSVVHVCQAETPEASFRTRMTPTPTEPTYSQLGFAAEKHSHAMTCHHLQRA
jgi:hypothetical protein